MTELHLRLECLATTVEHVKEAGTTFAQKCGSEVVRNLFHIIREPSRNESTTRPSGATSKGSDQAFEYNVDACRIPNHVSLEAAALLEPLSVAIHATRRASIEQGDTVIIFGAGTVGLLTAAMAKLSGATTVVIADIDAGRVEYALKNRFATKGFVVPMRQLGNETSEKLEAARELAADVVEKANDGFDGFEGADVSFDCTGKEICMQAGLYVSGCRCWRKIQRLTLTNRLLVLVDS